MNLIITMTHKNKKKKKHMIISHNWWGEDS